jgi:hypothetical protein
VAGEPRERVGARCDAVPARRGKPKPYGEPGLSPFEPVTLAAELRRLGFARLEDLRPERSMLATSKAGPIPFVSWDRPPREGRSLGGGRATPSSRPTDSRRSAGQTGLAQVVGETRAAVRLAKRVAVDEAVDPEPGLCGQERAPHFAGLVEVARRGQVHREEP